MIVLPRFLLILCTDGFPDVLPFLTRTQKPKIALARRPSTNQQNIYPILFFSDVLVCSTRPVPRFTDLRADELAELSSAVQRVGRVVERVYKADGLTIALQVRYDALLLCNVLKWNRFDSIRFAAGWCRGGPDRAACALPHPPAAPAGRSVLRVASRRSLR
jgi:hypothetical protein